MEQKSIGKFIASLRKANGYTQEELGEILGISNKTISSWENGNSNPDLAMLPIIADLFNVTCDELLRGEKIRDNFLDHNTKSEKIYKSLLKNLINKYINMTYISMGIFFASFCLMVVGIIFIYEVFGIILLVIGIIFYLSGIVFSCITFNDVKNRVNEDEENSEYYRILLNKSLLLKCLYSFFLLAPIFCSLKDKQLLNNPKYCINEKERETVKYNLKLKKIFSCIAAGIIFLCSLSIIVVEFIPEPYFSNEKYTLEQVKNKEYTFNITTENGLLFISNDNSYNNIYIDLDENIITSIKGGEYYFNLYLGDYDNIATCKDFYYSQNGMNFYIDYSDDYHNVQIIYMEKVLIEFELYITNRNTAYYSNENNYYETTKGIFAEGNRYYSLKDDIQISIILFSILLIMLDLGIYFIKKDKKKI